MFNHPSKLCSDISIVMVFFIYIKSRHRACKKSFSLSKAGPRQKQI